MPIRFLLWFSWFWIGGTFLVGIAALDQAQFLDPSNNPDLNDTLLIGQINIQQLDLQFVQIPIPVPSFGIFGSIARIVTWNYPFFTGGWEFVRLFVLLPITFTATWLILSVLGPILLQTISTLRNLLRI